MPRFGRLTVVAGLCAAGHVALTELSAFTGPSAAPGRQLRSRVSLAASKAEVDAAKKEFELKKWAASQLAGEGSPLAAAAAAKAQEAEAAYMALKDGAAAPAAPAAAPVAAAPAPVAAAPAAAPVAVPSAVSKEDLAEAKKKAQLLSWAADKLANEGSPLAAQAAGRAQEAEATYAAMQEKVGA